MLGAPGDGKTTIARRVAARMVDAGDLLIADTGVGLSEPPGEPDEYVQAIERLQSFGRPVILLLDDPLYADSPWLDVLRKLNRPGLKVGVLAASPQFLFDEHKSQLRACDLSTFEMARTSQTERESLAFLYGGTVSSTTEDDFLVVAMEAATGVPFREVIERLWLTLADGRDLSSARNLADLPWQSRAYLFVCFFSRAYESCPEPLLLKLLSMTGEVPETFNIQTELQIMRYFTGWRIFQIGQRERAKWDIHYGVPIAAAHTVIARQAWEHRPLAWDNGRVVGDAVIQASIEVPETIRDVSRLAVRLMSPSFAGPISGGEGNLFARNLIERWRHEPDLETRNFYDMAAPFSLMSHADIVLSIRDTLILRAIPASQGWLAALQLWFLRYDTKKQIGFPSEIDLLPIIKAADFSVASTRATLLGKRIKSDVRLRDAFVATLLDAFNGKLAWKPDSKLLSYLLSIATTQELAQVIPLVIAWLEEHPDDNDVRTPYLSLVERGGTVEQVMAVMRETREWLANPRHFDNGFVRGHFLALVNRKGTVNDVAQAVQDTSEWLDKHPDDTNVRTHSLDLIKHRGSVENVAEVVSKTDEWLENHPNDQHVRARFLGLVEARCSKDFMERTITSTKLWLHENSWAGEVRNVLRAWLSRTGRSNEAFDLDV